MSGLVTKRNEQATRPIQATWRPFFGSMFCDCNVPDNTILPQLAYIRSHCLQQKWQRDAFSKFNHCHRLSVGFIHGAILP